MCVTNKIWQSDKVMIQRRRDGVEADMVSQTDATYGRSALPHILAHILAHFP